MLMLTVGVRLMQSDGWALMICSNRYRLSSSRNDSCDSFRLECDLNAYGPYMNIVWNFMVSGVISVS